MMGVPAWGCQHDAMQCARAVPLAAGGDERRPERGAACSEVESFLSVPERRAKTPRIEAQNAAIARAMTSICNEEPGCFGVQGGHE